MRVLSIVHEPGATGGGGIFERAVPQRGHRLDRWVAAAGDAPPGDPSEWDAIMVFGGAMHPDQDAEHPWLGDEASFLETALADGVPLLGVCLGAQLIARSAGAAVGPAAGPEVGWHDVELGDDGGRDAVLGVLPGRFPAFQWHYYTFELPANAVQLASRASSSTPRSIAACSTTGSRRGRPSCRSPWRRSAPRPTACSRPGTSRVARSAMRSSTRRHASPTALGPNR
jgi:GMP synthase-like glutamine amidotransferase